MEDTISSWYVTRVLNFSVCTVCIVCTTPFYIRDLSAWGFWYPRRLLEPAPHGYEGWLYSFEICCIYYYFEVQSPLFSTFLHVCCIIVSLWENLAWKQPCLYMDLLLLALHVVTTWQAMRKDDKILEVIFEALSSRAAAFTKQFDKLWTDYICTWRLVA